MTHSRAYATVITEKDEKNCPFIERRWYKKATQKGNILIHLGSKLSVFYVFNIFDIWCSDLDL